MPDTADLDARIAGYLEAPLPDLVLDADAAGLQTQLTAATELQAQGEALLAEGRVAGRDVGALAQRVGELQVGISLLTTAGQPNEPAADAGGNDLVEQVAATGDTAGAEEIQALRDQLQAALTQINAAPQQRVIIQQNNNVTNVNNYFQQTNIDVNVGVVVVQEGDRFVLLQDDEYIVWRTPTEELDRLLYGAVDVRVDDLGNGFTRTIIFRAGNSQIVR